jgi:TatD DNase family protein
MIDTHAHLLYFKERADDIIKNMPNDDLENIINIGTTVADSKAGIELAEKNENIYAAVGIYPEYSNTTSEDDLKEIDRLAKCKKVVAIGEIGLDYHSEGFDKEKQKEIFLKQLEIADRNGLPFCIHCRGAAQDVYEILSKNKNLIKHSGLMHCYSEGSVWFKKFLDLGLYLSFSGNITFKKSDRSFLKDVPLDRILVETDSPYLSPEPLRGRENEPKNVQLVIEKIAGEIGMSVDELKTITTLNAKKFYGI